MRIAILALLLLVACGTENRENEPTGLDFAPVDTALALKAWTAAGLPDPSACPALRRAPIALTQVQEFCGKPACWLPGAPENCTDACTHGADTNSPWMVAASAPAGTFDFDHDRLATAHELFHVWSACLLGNGGDGAHTNLDVWATAIWNAQRQLILEAENVTN